MDGLRNRIMQIIRMRNVYDAQLKSLQLRQPEHIPLNEHMKTLQTKVETVDIWLSLLPASQAFIVRRHLVDRLDWESVLTEFNAKWGGANERSKRTIVRYQTIAIGEIEAFVRQNYAHFEQVLS